MKTVREVKATLTAFLVLPATILLFLVGCSATTSPEIGQWQLTLEGYCAEVYEFHADGTMELSSPPEQSKARYTLESTSEKGFYKLSFFITEHNGKPSCYGESSGGVGFENAFFLRFEDNNKTMRLFTSPDFNAPSGAFLTRQK